MKIFLDDIRFPAGEGWTIIRNSADFFHTWIYNRQHITHIAFDHDLGEKDPKTGYDLLAMVEEDYYEGIITHPIVMTVHSMNPVGRDKMVKVIKNLELKMIASHCK